MLIDDDEQSLRLLQRILARAGYANVRGTTNPLEAIEWMGESLPDLVVVDINMPALDGYGVLTHLSALVPISSFVPALAVTGMLSPETSRKALTLGAKDVVRKPFDPTELLLRVHNLLEMRLLYVSLERERRTLEERVLARTRDVSQANMDSLLRLARAAEYRDDETGRHTQRVGELSAMIARELGISEAEVQQIRIAASLHDVGKIGIPDNILLKPGPLTEAEYTTMKRHTVIGGELCAGGSCEVTQMAGVIARSHHERCDGSGYPFGLRGEDIPLVGRIVAVADFYDALSSARSYRPAWPREKVLCAIRERSGGEFDQRVVEAFFRCVPPAVRSEAAQD